MLEVGLKYQSRVVVSEDNTALKLGSGDMAVFATPAMIALMENAAFSLLKNEDKDSVGTEMNVKHTRACLVGAKVYAEATVTGVNGNWVTFNVAAYDEKGEIGNGNHTRYVIDPVKFMAKLNG
jgi:predicted thioesterase